MPFELFLLMFLVILFASAMVYSVEVYAYVCLVLGSIMRSIKNFINTTLGRKNIYKLLLLLATIGKFL